MKARLIAVAAIAAIALFGCSGGNDTSVVFPSSQQAFFAMNKDCHQQYEAGQNEIQKSLAFNRCNKDRLQFSKDQKITGWVGEIADISTDQGADVVSVQIKSTIDDFGIAFGTVNNRVSDVLTHSMITPANPLFNVLAKMREGDRVSFDAAFLANPEGARGVWEGSLTEQGSMDEPEFNVRFSGIRPYGESANETDAAKAADVAPAPAERAEKGAPENTSEAAVKRVVAKRNNYAATEDDNSATADALEAAAAAGSTEPVASASQADQGSQGQISGTYRSVKSDLLAKGYKPEARDGFTDEVDGDPASCGNAGCSIQWVRSSELICVGVSVNDNVAQPKWEASTQAGQCD